MKGCLWLLIVLALAVVLQGRALEAAGMPLAWPIAGVLGFGVMLSVGCLQGVLQALARLRRPEDAPANWRDGELVTVSGVVQPVGTAVQAPFSGRAAVVLEYEAMACDHPVDDPQGRARWNGFRMAPCVLRAGTRRLTLEGFPTLRQFPLDAIDDAPCLDAAARHLAETRWTLAPEIGTVDLAQAGAMLRADVGTLPGDLINARALALLETDLERMNEAELRSRLGKQHWLFRERVVAPGATVTVTGTFRANPQRLDVAHGVREPRHALQPGGAEKVARRQLWQALGFSAFFLASTAAAHYLVYADGGRWLRTQVIEAGLLTR